MAECAVTGLILEWERSHSTVSAEHVSRSLVASASGLVLWFSCDACSSGAFAGLQLIVL